MPNNSLIGINQQKIRETLEEIKDRLSKATFIDPQPYQCRITRCFSKRD